jgi:hypothetical protein
VSGRKPAAAPRALAWVLARLPERTRDWLAGVVVDVLWRAEAREQRKAQAEWREARHG